MKTRLLPALLPAFFCMAATPAYTQGTAPAAVQQTEGAPAVPAAFGKLTFLQGEPAKDARYYIYVQSASWCGPCRMYMPIIQQDYAQLREHGVEVILVGRDSTPEATLDYASNHYTFPVLQGSPELETALPGFTLARAIPHIQVVDKHGTVLLDGHPQHFFRDGKWRDLLVDWSTAPEGSIQADMDDENGHFDFVLRYDNYASERLEMVGAMGRHMRAEQKFQSRMDYAGIISVLRNTVTLHDIMVGFGLRQDSWADFTLTPAYLDSWRMLHTFQSKNIPRTVEGGRGGWGNILTTQEHQALQVLQKRLQGLIRPDMSDEEKVRAIHDDLVNRATYCKDGDPTVYGLIMDGTGNCDAYSRYIFLALNMVGIPCHRVVGADDFHHSWNLVKIGNKWYHLDAAWDDPSATENGRPASVLSHEYFCVPDAVMEQDHRWNHELYPGVTSNPPYPYRRVIDTPEQLDAALRQAYRSGASTFEAILPFRDYSVLQKTTCPIDRYAVTDPDTGYIVVYFDRSRTGAAPVQLHVDSKPTDSTESAARWHNVLLEDKQDE